MMPIALTAIAMALPAGDDRLVVGSRWHCAAIGLAEHYAADVLVEPGRSPNEKNLRVLSTNGDIALSGYGVGFAKADHFDKNGSELVAAFGQGFNHFGLSMLAQWDRQDEAISLNVHTWEPKAPSNEKRNEQSYLLSCLPLAQVSERG